ncbi:CHAD domain-containing protein [Pararhizobium mangrovi]|nr:CHAD domain-containing protein [Pararhizobium mangrovi]
MAYRIDPSAALDGEVRRIARRQLEYAVEALASQTEDENEAIHTARKRIKKVRGLYRLVRKAAPKAYGRENARLREAARDLSRIRDAAALVESVDDLRAHLSLENAPGELASVRENLARRRDALATGARERRDRMDRALKACRAAIDSLDDFTFGARGRHPARIVSRGFKRTVMRARSALDAAETRGSGDDFHDLRKRAKYHWMHVRLLEDAWPAAMHLRRREAKALADDAGDEHNLTVLTELMAEEPETIGGSGERELLHRLVGDHQAELRAIVLRRAHRLFREPAKRDAARLETMWRHEGD